MFSWILCGFLSLAVIVLVLKLLFLQKSIDEICTEFEEHLASDTNTLISISSGNPHAKRLAAQINIQLGLLRRQRLKYMSGDRELKEAVTNISHDLRTPLTAICGYLDLLENEEKSENTSRYLSFIAERAEALRQLTEELFRYSVILSVQDNLKMEDTSLNALLEESLASFYPAFTERSITPEVQMPGNPVMRRLDRAAVSRVFSNILSNALKYSDGDLTVKLCGNGEVIFSNSASGLDSVQAGKLFNRFFTVETARNSTGLGLAISKALVEQLGGSITADYTGGRLNIKILFSSEIKDI